MNIDDIYEYLSVLSNKGIQFGLDRVQKMLELLGHPDRSYKIIHIAGTNGKGSTSSFIYEILREAGYKTGVFRSPHTVDFFDRIMVDDYITEEQFIRIFEKIKEQSEKHEISLSIFEVITLIAIVFFQQEKCEFAILEVGMGGRLDATNAVSETELSIITKIGMDHTQYLGDTIEEIASEKAGIIREESDVVLYSQEESVMDVIKKRCEETHSYLTITNFDKIKNPTVSIEKNTFQYDEMEIVTRLSGTYQLYNAVTAITAIDRLRKFYEISDHDVEIGIQRAYLPARFDKIYEMPTIIYDGAHNPDGIRSLLRNLEDIYGNRKYIFVIGVMLDKEYEEEIRLLAPHAKAFVLYESESDRALEQEQLKMIIEDYNQQVYLKKTVENALNFVIEEFKDEIVLLVGTLYGAEGAYKLLGR